MHTEFKCHGCGETFIDVPPDHPGGADLVEHGQRENGTPCGSTQTEVMGTWVFTPPG